MTQPSTRTPAAAPSAATLPHPRRLIELGPHGGAHRVAARAGASVAIPLLALWATGHVDLSLYATFGAFTSLYGRQHTHLPRLGMQATAAAGLVAAVVLGTVVAGFDGREWIVIPVVAVFAGAATFLSDALRWHPPGSLFFVFALAACASVPADASRIPIAFAVAGASALLSMVIATIGIAHPGARRLPPTPLSVSFRAAARRPGEGWAIARVTIGVVLAGVIPTATGLGHPYWAMVSVVAALSGADAAARLVRAGHRVLGTFVGLALAAGILALQLPPLATIVVVVLLQIGAELFVGRNYGLTMVFVTPLALAMVELAHEVDRTTLIRDRALETVLGAAIGIALTLLALALERRRMRATA